MNIERFQTGQEPLQHFNQRVLGLDGKSLGNALVLLDNDTELSRCDRGGEAAEGAVACSEMLAVP